MFNGNYPSVADIAAVTRNNNGMNNGYGMFGGEMWWAWIILFAMFGWGNGGWGGNWGGNGNNTESILQRSLDTQSIIQKLDGINSGICSLGYDQLNQMNGINTNIMQMGWALERSNQANAVAAMQQQFALQQQISSCCCENKSMLGQLKYDMATSDCSIKTLMQQLFQQLMWGQQNNFRDLSQLIESKFCQLSMAQKDETIASLRQQLSNCDRDGALESLYNRLTMYLKPPAMPAYPACNPNGVGNWAPQVLSGNGWSGNWNNGCGCNNNNSCCA